MVWRQGDPSHRDGELMKEGNIGGVDGCLNPHILSPPFGILESSIPPFRGLGIEQSLAGKEEAPDALARALQPFLIAP